MPAVGQIVNYVLDSQYNQPGEIRPAIITRVWTETTVNLRVITDGQNDYPYHRVRDGAGILAAEWRTSVVRSDDYAPRTWHPVGVPTGTSEGDPNDKKPTSKAK